MSDNETSVTIQASPAVDAPRRSLKMAYALLLVGFSGAHRFYVGRWLTAFLYPCLTIVGPILFEFETVGYLMAALLVIDGLLLPRFVTQKNAKLAADFESHPERFVIADADNIAPWARGREKRSGSGLIANAIRTYFFFWFIPFLTGVTASELKSLELLIIPIGVLAAIGLLSSLDQTLQRYPTILEIPGLGPALERVAEMRAHYWTNEPRIGSAVKGLFLRARHEYKPYWSLAGIVVATVIIEAVISYEDNTSYISWQGTAEIIGIAALIAACVTLINLVPITALSFHYSLSGKRTRLGFMTVGALAATIAGFTVGAIEENRGGGGELPSTLSSMRLDERMKDSEFRAELVVKIDVFLSYYIGSGIDEETMKKDLANLIAGIAPNDESNAFGIIDGEDWSGVLYHHDGAQCATKGYNDYSLLAVVYKPSDEDQAIYLEQLTNDETLGVLDIIEYMNQKWIYYRWRDVPEVLHAKIESDGCRTLICDVDDMCPWLE